jgi:hypothetical protein
LPEACGKGRHSKRHRKAKKRHRKRKTVTKACRDAELLAVPVPGSNVPRQVVEWIEGPPPQAVQLVDDDAADSRPLSGLQAR